MSPAIAVLVPCYNEALTIGDVVRRYRAALPQATVYVYDNNSTDGSPDIAAAAGAVVRYEPLQGKGNVVRRMFADVEADVYVMVDGDGTYDPDSAAEMVRFVTERQVDMVVGVRRARQGDPWRLGHRFGNRMLTALVAWLFGNRFRDILSGYRAFSRRFVKSFPADSHGFETETELTVHALELRLPVAEVETPYDARPEGSESKLSTYRDGLRILRMTLLLLKEEKPLAFFGVLSLLFAGLSVLLFYPVFVEYLETGLVLRQPTAVLSMGLMVVAFLSLTCGVILDSVSRGRREQKRLAYLAQPAPAPAADVRERRPAVAAAR